MSVEKTLSTEYEATQDVYNMVIGKLYTELDKNEEGSVSYKFIRDKLNTYREQRDNLKQFNQAQLAHQRSVLNKTVDDFIVGLSE